MSMCHAFSVSLGNRVPWCESVHGGVAGGRGYPVPGATFAFDGRRAYTNPSILSLRLGGARPKGLFGHRARAEALTALLAG